MPDDTAATRADLLRRLYCAEGHLRSIARMIEGGTDCASILHQTLAVRAALGEINRRLVKHHLATCLREGLNAADPAARQRCLAEVVSLYELSARKEFA